MTAVLPDLAHVYLSLDGLLSGDERIRPGIAEWYEEARFPRELVPEMGELAAGDSGLRISLEHSPLRHADSLESVRTYEGTDEIHTLVMGPGVTGVAAFGGAS